MVRNPLTRRFEAQTVTALGFGLVIGLLLFAIVYSLHSTSEHDRKLSQLVRASATKTDLAHTMREAIRGRISALRTMASAEGAAQRDPERTRFLGYITTYTRARVALLELMRSDAERAIMRQLHASAGELGPVIMHTLDVLFRHSLPQGEIETAVQAAIDGHLTLLGQLDDAVRTIQETTQDRIRAAQDEIHDSLLDESLLGVAIFLLAALTATLVVINAGASNRQLSHQAAHDALTGLLNRQAFEATLRLTLEQCRTVPDTHALLYLDLDRFKLVNDSSSHAAGDALLQQLSALLAGNLRHSDVLARIGGDEFGVLLRHTESIDAENVAEKLRRSVEEFTFNCDDQTFKVGASIGMVPFGTQPTTVAALLSTADACCYSAKEEGRNRVHHADSNAIQAERRSGEMRWVNRITDAIHNDRFVLYGQLIKPMHAKLDDGRLALEVLLRMRDHEGLGLIPPGQFLPAAERYGVVPEIDRWVVRNSLAWLADLGSDAKHMRININICGPSASDPHFHHFVRDCINHSGVPPKSLCFEITESSAIRSLANAAALIDALGDLGCEFALDDFGSGLSSFNQLRHLKVDYLKIDGSFIHNIDRDPINRALVESINTIGKKLGKRTVAEFVENDRINRILREIDVDYAQGFGLHRPEPLSDIRSQIRRAQDNPDHRLIVA